MADLTHTTIGIGAVPNDGNGTPARTAASATLNPELDKLLSAVIYDDSTNTTRALGIVRKSGTHPTFELNKTSSSSGQTGDGTVATAVFNNEVLDQGSNVTTTTFTAPVSGEYALKTTLRLGGLDAAHDDLTLLIVTSNKTFPFHLGNVGPNRNSADQMSITLSVDAFLDASDTALIQYSVAGGTQGVALSGGADGRTTFSGTLIA